MDEKLPSFERRLAILIFILHKKHTTTYELSNTFKVGRTTIYRDIILLSRYAPIYTKTGTNGGVYAFEDTQSKLLLPLSVDERQLLIKMQSKLNKKESLLITNIICKYSNPLA